MGKLLTEYKLYRGKTTSLAIDAHKLGMTFTELYKDLIKMQAPIEFKKASEYTKELIKNQLIDSRRQQPISEQIMQEKTETAKEKNQIPFDMNLYIKDPLKEATEDLRKKLEKIHNDKYKTLANSSIATTEEKSQKLAEENLVVFGNIKTNPRTGETWSGTIECKFKKDSSYYKALLLILNNSLKDEGTNRDNILRAIGYKPSKFDKKKIPASITVRKCAKKR